MRNEKTYKLIILSILSAIEIIMSFTPVGYLQIGLFYLTTMHIPAIIAGIYFGWKEGAFLGLVFGMTSLVHATLIPSPDSVFFSPFYSENICSLIVALLPRMMLGIAAAFIYDLFKKMKVNDLISISLSCIIATVVHTVLVLNLIYLFFIDEYNALTQMNYTSVIVLITATLASNGIAEAILASLIGTPLIKAVRIAGRTK